MLARQMIAFLMVTDEQRLAALDILNGLDVVAAPAVCTPHDFQFVNPLVYAFQPFASPRCLHVVVGKLYLLAFGDDLQLSFLILHDEHVLGNIVVAYAVLDGIHQPVVVYPPPLAVLNHLHAHRRAVRNLPHLQCRASRQLANYLARVGIQHVVRESLNLS